MALTASRTGMVPASRRIRYSNTRSVEVSVRRQVELLIRTHECARQLLRVSGQIVVHAQKDPWHVLPHLRLRLGISGGAPGGIGGAQPFLDRQIGRAHV